MIYISHGDKQLSGEDGIFNHDPGLDGNCIPQCKKLCKSLISLYGFPVKIVSSPYRICRETATVLGSMVKNFRELNKDSVSSSPSSSSILQEITVDTSLSYYLGNVKHLNVNVTPQTQSHRPPFHENIDDMKHRVEKHVTTQKKYFTKKNGPVWYITHSNILNEILSSYSSFVSLPTSSLSSISTVPLFTFCIKETNEFNKLDLIKIK